MTSADYPGCRYSRWSIGISALFLCLSFGGCATSSGPATVVLRYEPVTKLRVASPATLTVISFADRREKAEVGSIFLLHTVPGFYDKKTVSSDQAVGDWVSSALRSELRRAGHTVRPPVANDTANQGTGVVISGEVLEAAGKSLGNGGRADVRIKIVVQKSGTDVFSKEYEATGRSGDFARDGLQRAYTIALQKLLEKAMPELLQVLE